LVKDLLKNDDEQHKDFLQNLGFLVVKNQLPLQFVKNVWFKHLILLLCLQVVFPSNFFFHEILPKLVEKMKHIYVLPKLEDCISTSLIYGCPIFWFL
jgi:hypothetical protein